MGAYADLETNLTSGLLANVAGRYENYSDFGSRVTGKLALRYQPTKRFVLRGAASTGFRAPGLAQSFFSHVTTNVIGGQFQEIGNFPVSNHASQIFGAKPLKEETSVNLSAGFAFTPADNFTITVDYFHIQIDNRILLGATFNDSVSQAILADSGFADIARRAVLHQRARHQDRRRRLHRRLGGAGRQRDLRSQPRRQLHQEQDHPRRSAAPDSAGHSDHLTSILDLVTEVGIEEERPDWRGTLQANYSIGRVPHAGTGQLLRRVRVGTAELHRSRGVRGQDPGRS